MGQGVELKMPDEKYSNIQANQTGFAKAAVDRSPLLVNMPSLVLLC